MDFETSALGGINLDDIFGQTENRPPSWHKFRLFFSKLASDLNFHTGAVPQTILMNDAAHALGDQPAAAVTIPTSTTLLVDAESAGASEELTINEAQIPTGKYLIRAIGGEGVVIKNTAGTTICTIATGKSAIIVNTGTALHALLGA